MAAVERRDRPDRPADLLLRDAPCCMGRSTASMASPRRLLALVHRVHRDRADPSVLVRRDRVAVGAAEEMVDPRRDIPVAIARAGFGQPLMYAIPILAVLVVLPTEQLSSLHGLIDAMKTVFTVYGGSVASDGSVTLIGAGPCWAAVGACVHLGVVRQRLGLDHGRRPGPGRSLPRRRRAGGARAGCRSAPACRCHGLVSGRCR